MLPHTNRVEAALLQSPAYQPPTFTPAAFSFAEIAAASRPAAGDLLSILTGAVTTGLVLIELRPILRAVAWVAGVAA